MLFLPPTLISVIEVLLVIVPTLFSIAYVTVAERKTMASMQRRLGPSQVGLMTHNSFLYMQIRPVAVDSVHCFHSSSKSLSDSNSLPNKSNLSSKAYTPVDIINTLYKDRIAPVIPFTHPTLISCSNFMDKEEKSKLLKKLSDLISKRGGRDLGVIYIFQYKYDPNVYYIGKTTSLNARLTAHLTKDKFDKYHLTAKKLGWSNFTLSIVEICKISDLAVRENFYLFHYKPILNTVFRSSYSASVKKKVNLKSFWALRRAKRLIVDTVSGVQFASSTKAQRWGLEVQKSILNKINEHFPVWVYKLTDEGSVNPNFIKYPNRNSASKATGISLNTINLYLNTQLPKRGLEDQSYLFFSHVVNNIASLSLALQEAISFAKSEGIKFDSNIAKKVWVYTIDSHGNVSVVNNKPFQSRVEVGNFLATSTSAIRYNLDNYKQYKGYYLFNKSLANAEIKALLEHHNQNTNVNSLSNGKIKIYAYLSENLELLNNRPFPSIQATMDYFQVMRRTIFRYLDSDLIFKSNDLKVFLYSEDISAEKVEELKNNFHVANLKVKPEVWVYTADEEGRLILFQDQPFSSMLQAGKALNMSSHTVKKYIDSFTPIKGYYLFKTKQKGCDFNPDVNSAIASGYRNAIWVYRIIKVGNTCSVLLHNNQSFDTIGLAARTLNISDMTINKYLDTCTDHKGFYFFSGKQEENGLLLKLKEVADKAKGYWVYKKINDQYSLLENQPHYFKSKWQAAKELKLSHKNMDKYLDTHLPYKNYFFFSEKL